MLNTRTPRYKPRNTTAISNSSIIKTTAIYTIPLPITVTHDTHLNWDFIHKKAPTEQELNYSQINRL